MCDQNATKRMAGAVGMVFLCFVVMVLVAAPAGVVALKVHEVCGRALETGCRYERAALRHGRVSCYGTAFSTLGGYIRAGRKTHPKGPGETQNSRGQARCVVLGFLEEFVQGVPRACERVLTSSSQ